MPEFVMFTEYHCPRSDGWLVVHHRCSGNEHIWPCGMKGTLLNVNFLTFSITIYYYSILYMSYVRYDSDIELSLNYVYGTVHTVCAGFTHLLFAVQCQCASWCV